MVNAWIVCENSGRWAAALRVALARHPTSAKITPKIREVRSLAELNTTVGGQPSRLGLVEIRPENLAAALEFLAKAWRRNIRFVALLDDVFRHQPSAAISPRSDRQLVANALWEAGALEVIGSPRAISSVLNVAERHAAWRSKRVAPTREHEAIADRAWAALPWQDAESTVT